MKAKEFLRKIIHINMMIDCKTNQVAELRGRLTSISSALGKDKVQTSLDPDKFTDTISKIMDLEMNINSDIDLLIDCKIKARRMIEQLDEDIEKVILYKRYFEGKGFEQIADECAYSLRWIHTLHGKALIKLDKLDKVCSPVH